MRLIFCALLALSSNLSWAHKSCEDSLRHSRLNQYLARDIYERPIEIVGKKGVAVPAYTKVTRGNISHIFRHQYDPKNNRRWGAKAVAFRTYFGPIQVWFFQTGEGATGFNVHHRDLASLVAEHYGEAAYEWLSHINEMAAQFRDKLPVKKPDDFFISAQIWLDESGSKLRTASRKIKERGSNRQALEDHDVAHLLTMFQGFQLTAEMVNGELRITELEVDSALTAWQRQIGVPLDPSLQQALLDKTVESIGKSLRNFRTPTWPAGLNWLSK